MASDMDNVTKIGRDRKNAIVRIHQIWERAQPETPDFRRKNGCIFDGGLLLQCGWKIAIIKVIMG